MILEIERYIDHNKKHRKRCLVKCDKCETEGWRNDYYAVKNKDVHICRKCSSSYNGSLLLGKTSSFKGKKRKADNEYIVGSTYINSSGYIEEYVGRHAYPDRKGGYYLQHRKVVEEDLDRRLTENEKVHHIDGNKQNNELSNLFVCESMSAHKYIHKSLENAAFELVKLGIIAFDREKEIYIIAPTSGDG